MRERLALYLFALALVASGAAGLGYQIVWTRTLGVGLGHEIISILAVVSAFFAGLALGAWWLGQRVRSSPRPGYWYIGLELVVGIWGLVLLPLLDLLVDHAPLWLGTSPGTARQLLLVLGLPTLAFAPATIAMGATLPAMAQVLVQAERHRHIGVIYAVNTFGALVGVLGFTFWIIPAIGFRDSTLTLVALNGGSALLAALGVGALAPRRGKRTDASPIECAKAPPSKSGHLGGALLWTGFLGIAFESLVVRVMSQVFEGAIYSFAAVLAVYLVGTVVGAAAYQHWGARARSYRGPRDGLAIGTAASTMLGIGALYQAFELYRGLRLAFGDSLLAVAAAEVCMAVPILLIPSAFMGALFCHLVQAAQDRGRGFGWGISLNTLGAALAPGIAVMGLLPLLGAKWALVAVALGYLSIASWRWQSRHHYALALVPVLIALALPSALRIVTLREGERIIDYREGAIAAVSVIERRGAKNLRINNRFQMGGTVPRAVRLQRRQAHIPLLLHPAPARVLFLGVASGVTTGTVVDYPGVRADAVELVPEALEMLPHFAPVNRFDDFAGQVRLFAGDARRHVRAGDTHYDVIIADLFHPGRDGSGFLYTHEHFQAIEARLADEGLFCQWLPLYQLGGPMLRSIVASFNEVFPWGFAMLANFDIGFPALGLIGRRGPSPYPNNYLARRLDRPASRRAARHALLHDERRLFGLLVLGPADLRQFAGKASTNTDDHPRVLFEGPRFTYRRDLPPYRQLASLLARPAANPGTLLDGAHATTEAGRRQTLEIGRYIRARDLYLRGQILEHERGAEHALALYEASVRTSEAFTASLAKLLALARRLANTDPARALRLVESLAAARPGVAPVEQMLRALRARRRITPRKG